MATMTPATKRRRPKRDVIYRSRPYQWLVEQEKKGKFKRFGLGGRGQPGHGLEKRIDRVVGPFMEKAAKKIGRK